MFRVVAEVVASERVYRKREGIVTEVTGHVYRSASASRWSPSRSATVISRWLTLISPSALEPVQVQRNDFAYDGLFVNWLQDILGGVAGMHTDESPNA